MKRISIFALLFIFSTSIFAGCGPQMIRPDGSSQSNAGYCALNGALLGAGVGAATHLKKLGKNMLIGAAAGFFGGLILCKIIENETRKAAIEAARVRKPVEYNTDKGQRIRATPVAYNPDTHCQEIKNEAWDTDGTYLGGPTRTVCPDNNGNLQVTM